jgi:inosine-uridine nucleoside N-ribohydrolase
MHDPLAVLTVTHPTLMTFQLGTVTVELEAGRRGVTTARRHGGGDPVGPVACLATDVDGPAARDVLVERLAGLR